MLSPTYTNATVSLYRKRAAVSTESGITAALWQWSVCPKVISLAFDCSSRHTLNKISLEAKEDDEHRKNTKHGTGNQYIVVVSVGCKQGVQTNRKRKLLCASVYEHRPKHVIP